MLDSFKRRFAAARAADAAELEQAVLRIWIWPITGIYYLTLSWDWDHGGIAASRLVFAATFNLVCFAWLAWILAMPGVNHARRRLVVALEMSLLAIIMETLGEAGAVMFPMFLWVAVGNGFRYGRWYLHYAQVLSLCNFGALVYVSAFWRAEPALVVGIFFLLLAIPAYVGVLLGRLRATTQRLEEAHADALAANVTKTRFLAAASHDLRQPMQALSMYASVLEERSSDPASKRVVHGIQLSTRTLERLFDSLLDISKIESGVIRPSVVPFPLAVLIEQVVEAERSMAAQKGLELRAVHTSAWVQSDPALLERILKNLVTNAIRYTERGRIVVGCRRAAGGLRLEVVDTGIGIAAEEQQRIFDDYYQIDGVSGQGLGLGLPIVKSLGELLGHSVSVRSAPGRGSVFAIGLPRSAAVTAPEAAAQLPVVHGGCVVLVDDDVEIRRSMQLLLEGWGYELVSGASAADVEAALQERGIKPDALIVDYRLAGASTGTETVERLRAAFGESLPTLVITGNANVAAVRERAPGLRIAVKPVPPGKLRAFLSHAMSAV